MTELYKRLIEGNTFGELDKQQQEEQPQQETNRKPQPQRGTIDSPFIKLVQQKRQQERLERIAQERKALREYYSLKNRAKRVWNYLWDL